MKFFWLLLAGLLALGAWGQELPADRVFVTPDPTPRTAEAEVIRRLAERMGDLGVLESVAVVENIAQLYTVDPVVFPDAITKGYYSSGDGGRTRWKAEQDLSGTNTWGGKIPSRDPAWAWRAVPENGFLNAKQFGAVADGVTPCTEQLNAFITYQTNNWQTVAAWLPPGPYLVTNPVVFGSNARLYGVPGTSMLRRGWSQQPGEGKRMAILRNLSWEGLSDGLTHERDTNIVINGWGVENPFNPGSTTNALWVGPGFAAYYVRDFTLENFTSINSESDWNVTIWGNNTRVLNLTVMGSQDVFEDGLHYLGGTNHVGIGGRIECGDDVVAFSSFNGVQLSQASVKGIQFRSKRGHALRVMPESGWTTNHTTYIGDIVAEGFVGTAGEVKNGGIAIRELPVTSTPIRMLRNITAKDFYVYQGEMAGRTESQIASWPVSIGGATNVILDNVNFWPAYKDALYVEYSQDVKVSRCRFQSPFNTNDVCVDILGSSRVTLDRCFLVATNGNNGILLRDGSTDVEIANTEIESQPGIAGVRVYSSTGTETLRLIGNKFRGSGDGVQLSLGNIGSLVLLNNVFASTIGTEVQFYSGTTPATLLVQNNDGYTYPTPVSQLWAEASGSASVLAKLVRTDVSQTNSWSIQGGYLLHTGANGLLGWVFRNTTSDAADKAPFLGTAHYTNAEEPFGIRFSATSSANQIQYGGGSSIWNAATLHNFYTAPNTTTTTGTEAFRVSHETTAGRTRLWLYDVDNGQMENVTVGAADSGGVGFKVLRIPN